MKLPVSRSLISTILRKHLTLDPFSALQRSLYRQLKTLIFSGSFSVFTVNLGFSTPWISPYMKGDGLFRFLYPLV